MVKGLYVVRKGGVEICRAHNLITDAGKQLILKYLAEYIGSMSGAIAVGAGSTAPTTSDIDMEYEFDRAAVDVRSADYDANTIAFLATLPQESEGVISELGLWSNTQNPSAGQYQSDMLLLCDSSTESWSGTFTWDEVNFWVGSEAIHIIGGNPVTINGIDLDLSGYSNSDQFAMLYMGGLATTATMTFTDVDGGQSSYVIPVANSGKQIARFTKANFSVGVAWDSIVSVTVTTNGSLTLDSLRINDTDSYAPDYGLVSRAILSTPFTKDTTSPYEIEYTMGFGIA